MTLNNLLYGGNTQILIGSTYISTHAYARIQEGYDTGATTEYVDKGEYNLDSFSYGGAFNQALNLTLNSPIKQMGYNNLGLARTFKTSAYFFDDFGDSYAINRNYITNQSGIWSVSNGQLIATVTSGANNEIIYTGNQSLSDIVLTMKFKVADLGTANNATAFILARLTDTSSANLSGYQLNARGGAVDQLQLYRVDSNVATLLDSVSYTPTFASDTFYWIRFILKGNELKGYLSADGLDFSQYQVSVVDNTYPKGSVGMRTGIFAPTVYTFERFSLAEIGGVELNSELLTHAVKLSNIKGVTMQEDLTDFTGFIEYNGASVVSGTTNGIPQIDLYSSGNTNQYVGYIAQGASYSDFILEYEALGVSGAKLGMLIGDTITNTMHFNSFVTTYGGSFDHFNEVTGLSIASGGVPFVYSQSTDYINPALNKWDKFKVVKSGRQIRWYMNDLYIGDHVGVSVSIDSSLDIGFIYNRNNSITSPVSIRNPRIITGNVESETVQADASSTPATLFTRYLPDGFEAKWHTDHIDVFQTGASRRTGFGITNYIIDSIDSVNNTVPSSEAIANLGAQSTKYINTDNRAIAQKDRGAYTYLTDNSITSNEEAESRLKVLIDSENINTRPVTIQTAPKFTLETYDQVNIIDQYLGLSNIYRVDNINKSYDAGTGTWIQSLYVTG